jgi:hypothetical protein
MRQPLREVLRLSKAKFDDSPRRNFMRRVTVKRTEMSARPNVATMNSKANVSIDRRAVKISGFSAAHQDQRNKHNNRRNNLG